MGASKRHGHSPSSQRGAEPISVAFISDPRQFLQSSVTESPNSLRLVAELKLQSVEHSRRYWGKDQFVSCLKRSILSSTISDFPSGSAPASSGLNFSCLILSTQTNIDIDASHGKTSIHAGERLVKGLKRSLNRRLSKWRDVTIQEHLRFFAVWIQGTIKPGDQLIDNLCTSKCLFFYVRLISPSAHVNSMGEGTRLVSPNRYSHWKSAWQDINFSTLARLLEDSLSSAVDPSTIGAIDESLLKSTHDEFIPWVTIIHV